jgi:hypothetical protein
VQLQVRIGARGVARERLLALVTDSNRCSPMSDAMRNAVPFEINVRIEGE